MAVLYSGVKSHPCDVKNICFFWRVQYEFLNKSSVLYNFLTPAFIPFVYITIRVLFPPLVLLYLEQSLTIAGLVVVGRLVVVNLIKFKI